jgi:hypothetical protein
MGHVILIIVALVLIYLLFGKVLIPFYGVAVAFLGKTAWRVVAFFQCTLWTTAIGNLVVASVALLAASAFLYLVYRGLAKHLANGRVYDEAMKKQIVEYSVAEYKKPAAAPLAFKTGIKGLPLALRIATIVIALGAVAFTVLVHNRRGSLSMPLTISTLALGLAMTSFMAISFAAEARAACPKKHDDLGD